VTEPDQLNNDWQTPGASSPPEVWSPWIRVADASASSGHQLQRPQNILLIAEIANTHEGRWEDALKLVDLSAEAGCGAVKFQKYYAAEMLAPGHSMMSTFAGWEWPPEIWRELIERAHENGLLAFVDVFGVRAFKSLAELPAVDGLKIHAADVGNLPLLDLLSETTCPVFIGTGGCSDLDLYSALTRVGRPERFALMHGYQAFPSRLEDTDLLRIHHLKDTFQVPVGLSEHLDADDPFSKVLPMMAIPLGVCCIEKHIILDRSLRGIDNASSLNPEEMAQVAEWIKQAELALGQQGRNSKESEESYHRRFKKSLMTTGLIASGEKIAEDKLAYQIVENSQHFSLYQGEAVGKVVKRDVPSGSQLTAGDLNVSTGLCLIVRLKSQRLPRKALEDICGQTAIQRLIVRAKMCDAVERTVLCTSTYLDDAPLLNIAKENGLDIYAGSPDQPLERLIACAEMYGWQYVIRATGDNIFLDPDLLSQAVKLATDENLDYVSMTTAPVGSACEVFSTFALRTVQELANAPFTTEYLTWFVADNPNFRTMDLPIPSTLQRNYRLTLDTPDDLANIRDVTTRLGQDSSTFNLADVIAAVESDSELKRRCTFVPQATNAPAEVKFAFNVGSNIRSPE